MTFQTLRRVGAWGVLALLVVATAPGCSSAPEASQSQPAQERKVPKFDGDRAFRILEDQVAFGARCPGSPEHERTLAYLRHSLEGLADSVTLKQFTAAPGGKSIRMTNVIACFNPYAKRKILLAAHWDTRPTADLEVTPEKRARPILGANDGASGVAVLLELARLFKQQPPEVGVVMVLFDGEDYGPGPEDMLLGSRHFAGNLGDIPCPGGRSAISYGILLDMVGDKDLRIPQEGHSLKSAPDVVRKVWDTAAKLGHENVFVAEEHPDILDDHVPLIEAGLPCIDIIDFDYAPWHTLEDTPDKCSPISLRIVGEVVAAVVYGETAH